MALAHTIDKAVGHQYKGQPAPNEAKDVATVQKLLRAAFGKNAPRLTPGKCDPVMKNAIAEFQRLWSDTPDASVYPNQTTLKRLNAIITPFTLDPIEIAPIAWGGYKISYDHGLDALGGLPKGKKSGAYRVFLHLGDDKHMFELSGRKQSDVLGSDNLPAFLDVLYKIGKWGTDLDCSVVLQYGDAFISKSKKTRKLSAPVKPYDGPMTIAGFADDSPRLTYPGNGHGRMLTAPINGHRYFRYGKKFDGRIRQILETDNKMRGFDCTTFPMALFETYPSMAGKYGSHLAKVLAGDKKWDLDAKKAKDVKAFFADRKKGGIGLYILFSEGHVLLVKNGTIHEFTYGGYKTANAQSYARYHKAANGLWWARKLPAKYNP